MYIKFAYLLQTVYTIVLLVKECDMYLYVIEFSDGDIKVGRTQDFTKRLKAHASNNKMIGKRDVSRYFHKKCINLSENHVIQYCVAACVNQFGAEYFSGVSFDDVSSLIDSDDLSNVADFGGCIVDFDTNSLIPSESMYMNATLLVRDANIYRGKKGLNVIPLTVVLKSSTCKDMLTCLKKKYPTTSLIQTVGQGAGRRTYVHRELGVAIASYMSMDFKVAMYMEVAKTMFPAFSFENKDVKFADNLASS